MTLIDYFLIALGVIYTISIIVTIYAFATATKIDPEVEW